MTFPLTLPATWFQVWRYTYTQKDGHKNRMLIRRCLHEGSLYLFKPSDVVTDQMQDKYSIYVGDPSICSVPSKIPTMEQFKSMLNYMPYESFIDMGLIDPAVARISSSLNLMNLR